MLSKLILVLNCGSSSLKFAVINANNGKVFLSGIAECFYLPQMRIKWKIEGNQQQEVPLIMKGAAHNEALNFIVNSIISKYPDIFLNIKGIGHRIVHGGEKYTASVIINESVIQSIKDAIPFAPLHNPAHLIGIEEARKFFPKLKNKNVAVFDTAFHQTMPEESYLYALPYKLYKKYGIRRYGFHGTSHYYVTQKAAKMLNKPVKNLNIITCHLGNGSSIAAIRNGKSVDTSMGLTPLEGLVMGTRVGDIDPAIIFFLHENLGIDMNQIRKMLISESGLLGLTEVSSDFRYIEKNYFTHSGAKRAMDVYCHRLAKYISSYVSLMEGQLDGIVFTGGIGENVYMVRMFSVQRLSILDCYTDNERNLYFRFGKSGFINKEGTRPLLVIPTNEELIIAQDTLRLIN